MTEITSFLNNFGRGTYNCCEIEGDLFKTNGFLQNFDGLFLRTKSVPQELNVPRPKLLKKFVISVRGMYKIIYLSLHIISHKARRVRIKVSLRSSSIQIISCRKVVSF